MVLEYQERPCVKSRTDASHLGLRRRRWQHLTAEVAAPASEINIGPLPHRRHVPNPVPAWLARGCLASPFACGVQASARKRPPVSYNHQPS